MEGSAFVVTLPLATKASVTSLRPSELRTQERPASSAASLKACNSFEFTASRRQLSSSRQFVASTTSSPRFTGLQINASVATQDYEAVRQAIRESLPDPEWDDGSRGPVLVRLAWHAAGTYDKSDKSGGSDGATMRYAPESEDGANAGLNWARDFLLPIKEKHPWISFADLWSLAGAVAVEVLGGPVIPWKPGRTDAESGEACPPTGRLPDATQGQDHLRAVFYRMGFNDQEIVALSGAHALGRCHTDRSGFDGPWTATPTKFTNDYYENLINYEWTPKKWDGPLQYEDPSGKLMMLPTDLALVQDPEFKKYVEAYAKDEQLFFKEFAEVFGKLLALGTK